ncbi:MAG: hypothetical protein KF749_07325 [Bacteroidetes bacterium]|nr:hypothetical protein [Bacteroidota bacterium]MCW5896583.1 hypothetical protein [Bacteroidota bacterium]
MSPFLSSILRYAIRLRCPQCGEGNLYVRWNVLRERCTQCGCLFQRREEEGWFFIYMTTAGLTGVVVVGMLLIDVPDILLGQIGVLLAWFVIILLTLPLRKAIAIGIDYYVERQSQKIIDSEK